MKILRIFFFAFCALFLFRNTAKADAPQIKVTLDFESARFITTLLAKNEVSDAELKQAAELHGSKQLIAKVKGYSGSGEDVFKSTLKEIIETGSIKGDDNYNWRLVKSKLPQITSLINKIAANQQAFVADVTSIIQTYAPQEVKADVRASFLVGGGSLGFVNGGDGNTFNVALQKIGDDYEGLKYLVAHELYHSIQDAGQRQRKKNVDKSIPYYAEASYGVAYNLWIEGVANLVGDFTKIKTAGPFTKVQLEELQKNSDRKRQDFLLFELMIFKAYTDTASRDYEELYNIGFTTGFDEPMYYVGYEMAKKIEKYNGAKAIAALVVQDPLVFVEEYIKLYKANPKDESFVRFDPSTENIINKLAVWKDKV